MSPKRFNLAAVDWTAVMLTVTIVFTIIGCAWGWWQGPPR